jgi:hypothetical protein
VPSCTAMMAGWAQWALEPPDYHRMLACFRACSFRGFGAQPAYAFVHFACLPASSAADGDSIIGGIPCAFQPPVNPNYCFYHALQAVSLRASVGVFSTQAAQFLGDPGPGQGMILRPGNYKLPLSFGNFWKFSDFALKILVS